MTCKQMRMYVCLFVCLYVFMHDIDVCVRGTASRLKGECDLWANLYVCMFACIHACIVYICVCDTAARVIEGV